jgi:hypothetical protein
MATPLEIALQKKLAEKAASSGASTPSASVEYGIIRSYIDTMIDIFRRRNLNE